MTKDETRAMETAQSTQVHKNGRYKIGIPRTEGEPEFKNNFEMAFSRLLNLETSLLKKPDVAKAYCDIINDYMNKGTWRKCCWWITNSGFYSILLWWIMKRCWRRFESFSMLLPSWRARVLFEAIYSGPKLQRELVDVLTRFQRTPVALSADISQMFLWFCKLDWQKKTVLFIDFYGEDWTCPWNPKSTSLRDHPLVTQHRHSALSMFYTPMPKVTRRRIQRQLVPWTMHCT